MKLLSIHQAASARTVSIGGRLVATGIDKPEVPEARIDALGLVGDVIADRKHHGGLDQAVYIYSREDADWWEAEYGYPVANGGFGENLVFDSFGDEPVRVGDRFVIGEVTLEASAPRVPCAVATHYVGDPDFIPRFRSANRPGIYARVLTYGTITAGMPVSHTPASTAFPSLVEVFAAHYDVAADRATLERILASPVAERARREYQRRLDRTGR
jgi:MOSC domain-containing protein YiiM